MYLQKGGKGGKKEEIDRKNKKSEKLIDPLFCVLDTNIHKCGLIQDNVDFLIQF